MDDDEAARWAIALDGAPLTPALRAELDLWLAEDGRRQGALLRAQAVLAYLDRGRALVGEAEAAQASSQPLVDPTPDPVDPADSPEGTSGTTRRTFLFATAASVVVAAGFAIGSRLTGGQEIDTAVGEIRRLPLADGSLATVNTSSRLAVAMHANERTVRLQKGEAWFQVASDKTRPFVVEAGEARVRAVGTAFSVRRREGGAEVLVTEGVVETWMVGQEDVRQRIAAGSKGVLALSQPRIEVAEASQEIDRALAWRNGELVLKGETLEFAAAEMNRYNARKIDIGDPELGRSELVGFFRTNEPENFARAVSAMTGAHLREVNGRIVLERSGP